MPGGKSQQGWLVGMGQHEPDEMAKHIMQEGSAVLYGNGRSLSLSLLSLSPCPASLAFEMESTSVLSVYRDAEIKQWVMGTCCSFVGAGPGVGCKHKQLATPFADGKPSTRPPHRLGESFRHQANCALWGAQQLADCWPRRKAIKSSQSFR